MEQLFSLCIVRFAVGFFHVRIGASYSPLSCVYIRAPQEFGILRGTDEVDARISFNSSALVFIYSLHIYIYIVFSTHTRSRIRHTL